MQEKLPVSPPPPAAQASYTRAIVLLAIGGFASQAMVRSADSLLPQIAQDFAVTIGVASVAVWAYSLVHGSMQLFIGPIGDRFGKYPMVVVACAGACCVRRAVRCDPEPDGADDRAHRIGGVRGLDHSNGDGVHRRRRPLRGSAAGAGTLSLGPDHRAAVWSGRRRHSRRLARLAGGVFRAGCFPRPRGDCARPRACNQSADAAA